MAEFDENHWSQAKEETGAVLPIGAWLAPRSRLSKEQKKEAEVEVAAKAEAKTAKRERAVAAARAVEESQHQSDLDVCDLCATRFLSTGGLARHRNSGCGKRTAIIKKEKRKARRSVVRRLGALDELVIEGNRQRIKDLALVTVDLPAPESTAVAVGIEVEDDGGGLVITAVAGLALGSGLVGEGFVVVSVGGDPASADSIPTELAAGQKATFVFRRPLPHIPFHGSARETFHKEPRFVMPLEVEEWLRENAYDHDLGRDKMRPYVAYAALKAHFSGCLKNDTKTAMSLDQDQVAKWIVEQKKEEKNRRCMKRAAGKMAASSAEATSGSSSSKKAAKAPKKSAKKKTETAAEQEENEMSESDDDDDDDDDMGEGEMGGGAEFHAEW